MASTPQGSKTAQDKVRRHRDRLREQGLRPLQIWVPDTRAPGFPEEARRQALAVTGSGARRERSSLYRRHRRDRRRVRRGELWVAAGGGDYTGKPRPRRDRPGRPFRGLALGDGLCIDRRPHGCTAVSRPTLSQPKQRSSRGLSCDGRQDHDRSPGAPEPAHRLPLRHGHAADRPGDSRVPRDRPIGHVCPVAEGRRAP